MSEARSLSQVLADIQGGDKLAAIQADGHARRRQKLLEEVQQLVAAGQKPGDPIATYVTLFMGSASPESQAALIAKLREIDGSTPI